MNARQRLYVQDAPEGDLSRVAMSSLVAALALTPEGPCTIVDLGCGAGTLGELLKAHDSRRTVYGIEFMPEAAEEACLTLDRVITADLETLDPAPYAPSSVECLMTMDVLEHLISPFRVISRFLPCLKERGVLIASVPNMLHYTTPLQLLAGERFYNGAAADWHHLRFWTFLEVMERVEAIGFHIEEPVIATVSPPPSLYEEVLQRIERHMGPLLPDLRQHSHIVQYVFRARRGVGGGAVGKERRIKTRLLENRVLKYSAPLRLADSPDIVNMLQQVEHSENEVELTVSG